MTRNRLKAKFSGLNVYFKKNLIIMGFLGFSSGLPLLLTMSTLTWWLGKVGIDKKTIGLFALVGLPYSWKFLWAPFIDRIKLPLLSRYFGRRRSWLLVVQGLLMAAIIGMGTINPVENLYGLAVLSLIVAFWSATQDIIIDAYRIQLLKKEEFAAGAAMEVNFYRLGMMIAGAGALTLSDYMSWDMVYMIMALFMLVGMITTFFAPPTAHDTTPTSHNFLEWVTTTVVDPFRDFTQKSGWGYALLFVMLYKLGDVMMGPMATIFYQEIGFTGTEVGTVTKLFGIPMTILGSFLIGGFAYKWGLLRTLLVTGLLHACSNGMFLVLANVGHSIPVLYAAIALENISNGMAIAAFVAFLSTYCSPAFAATQYALLSSLVAQTRTISWAFSGWVADALSNWTAFFSLAIVLGFPSLLLLIYFIKSDCLKMERQA